MSTATVQLRAGRAAVAKRSVKTKKTKIAISKRSAKSNAQPIIRGRSKKWMTEFRAVLRAEIANCLTHGIGAGLSIAGLCFLVSFAAKQGDVYRVVSFAIYGGCMVMLYLASTLYHAFLNPRAKRFFKILDHSAIFLAIAGSYTPFTLVSMRGPWGWTLFAIVWGLAVIGVTFKIFFVNKFRLLSVLVYLLMGWLVIVAVDPMVRSIPTWGLFWIAAGGLSYTVGTAFYASRWKMSHMIWHLFVLGGSICHYLAVLFYVLPMDAAG